MMAVTLSRNSPRSSQRACAGEARLLWLSADLACVTGPVFSLDPTGNVPRKEGMKEWEVIPEKTEPD